MKDTLHFYKSNEQRLIGILNLITDDHITLADDPYSSFDAYNSKSIIELKKRSKVYATKMLEVNKMERNLIQAYNQNKSFVYIVWDNAGIFFLDVTKYRTEIRSLGITLLGCPKTSAFENNNKVSKSVYNVPQEWFNKLTL